MRQERTVQSSIFDVFAGHEIGRELNAISAWLDRHQELLGLVRQDLCRHGIRETGRRGLPVESALRCALLKQHRRAGVPSGGLGIVPRIRPAAARLEPEEVGPAQDDQRHPSRDMGGDQSDAARQFPARQGRVRQGGAA